MSSDAIMPLTACDGGRLMETASDIITARQRSSPVILMMGAHVIRSGVQRYLIDMMENGYISCIAGNGAAVIHDYELALIGATTEGVSKYIKDGQFGLWKETGQINDIINASYENDTKIGLGEAIGRAISEGAFAHTDISLLAAAYRLRIPATIHVGIGYDIIHEHPNCNGAATGALSYNDFLKFVSVVEGLQGGVLMSFGSAVMAPEVFLKALSMARNAASQENRQIDNFTTVVFDIHDITDTKNEPPKDCATYYFRPLKTILLRTVADGGTGRYIKGSHRDAIPALWSALCELRSAEP
ncbi:hypothetical protein [Candidatus Magnetominusculus dajiuhuensis]|uniref:ornithine cyclodeaminase family domain n=1 Tax=Candidatus Magnetominusculus dajiuhuensis TaxID=3137712 RepID=UPI003B43C171